MLLRRVATLPCFATNSLQRRALRSDDRLQFDTLQTARGWTSRLQVACSSICSGVLGEMTPLRVSTDRYLSAQEEFPRDDDHGGDCQGHQQDDELAAPERVEVLVLGMVFKRYVIRIRHDMTDLPNRFEVAVCSEVDWSVVVHEKMYAGCQLGKAAATILLDHFHSANSLGGPFLFRRQAVACLLLDDLTIESPMRSIASQNANPKVGNTTHPKKMKN